MKKLVCILVLIAGAVLAGCSFSSYSGHSLPGDIEYDFTAYNKTETQHFTADAGETVHIEYEAGMDVGKMTMVLTAPDQTNLWELKLDAGEDQGTQDVVLPDSGSYTMKITGDGAEEGRFMLKWTVE